MKLKEWYGENDEVQEMDCERSRLAKWRMHKMKSMTWKWKCGYNLEIEN